MSTQHNNIIDAEKTQVKQIIKYLRDHPDFFEYHPELLTGMLLPHESGKAVSLIERQVSILREQKQALKQKLNTLLNAARQNEQLIDRLNAFVLELMDAKTLDNILNIIQNRLMHDFHADAVVIRLFNTEHLSTSQRPEFVDWDQQIMDVFTKVIRGRKPICGNLKHEQLDALFSTQANQIASAALIPLMENDESNICYGMLAIGSHEKTRFQADMGTLFLSNLSKVITRVLHPHLKK